MAAFDWGSGENYLTLGGSITMGDDAQVDLSVTGEVDVRLFSALVPAGATAGHALLIANVQGPLDDPSLVGTIELTDAAVRMTDPRLTVSNLNGAILLRRNAVVIHEMTGEANGGRVAVEGTLTLNGFRPLGTVRLTAEFATHRRTVAFEQRIGRADRVSYAYSASFDRNRTFDKDPDPIFPFDITVNILRFTGSVLVASRNNLFDASNGWFHSSTTEYGFEPGEGALRFVKYFAQQYQYWPVGPIVLASAARLGLGSGLGGQVIPSERFFAGGGNTVRGYGQDSLGPHDFLGDARGGNALLVFNQEVRFPIVWRFRGVGFIDAGNVFETVPDISFTDLAVGTGLGLRVETPVGLFRFDYGFALRRDDDEPIGRFFFSIGQAF